MAGTDGAAVVAGGARAAAAGSERYRNGAVETPDDGPSRGLDCDGGSVVTYWSYCAGHRAAR